MYIPEYRNDLHNSPGENDKFRLDFAKLFSGETWDFSIYDLGTIQPGETIQDTYFAVGNVVGELVKKEILPIIIGGSQDLILACYKGFENLEQTINICAIDNRLDIGDPESNLSSDHYVTHLLLQRPCYLFNYAAVGIQRPLVRGEEMGLFEKLYFDICRLGEFNADFKKAEPYLRNSDILSIDINSVKATNLGGKPYSEPNGFRADQICQIARYAGLSDKLSCAGIFNVAPNQSEMADALLAQIVWYFIDGYSQRVGDFPIGSKRNYTKFHVHLDDFQDDLIFYKSNRSGRWWLEVSYPAGKESQYERHHMVPCDAADYQNAMENKIPDLWWRTLQKLST